MPPVIYLTGAPASGKSTLTRNLVKAVPNLYGFSFSEELRAHVARRAGLAALTEDGIRKESARIVTKEDVEAVDEKLIHFVHKQRTHRAIVIDSHPVTKEYFGFRVTPFSAEKLKELAPDFILCLYLDSVATRTRITASPMGRPLPSDAELDLHSQLQANIAVQYGIILNKPVYLLDGSVSETELVTRTLERLRLSTN